MHISEATRACLGDAFEVEDGRGSERDEYLKGTKTYLIVEKVNHWYSVEPCGEGGPLVKCRALWRRLKNL